MTQLVLRLEACWLRKERIVGPYSVLIAAVLIKIQINPVAQSTILCMMELKNTTGFFMYVLVSYQTAWLQREQNIHLT